MMLRPLARMACILAVVGAGWSLLHPADRARAQNRVDFARDVMPISQESCVGCHGPEQQMAGFRLDRRTAVSGNRIRPGSSAAAARASGIAVDETIAREQIKAIAGTVEGLERPTSAPSTCSV